MASFNLMKGKTFLNCGRSGSSKTNNQVKSHKKQETQLQGSGNSGLVGAMNRNMGDDDTDEEIATASPAAISFNGNKRVKVSMVWRYFKKSEDKKFAKCITCGKEYKTSGNTSNLKDHLKRFHSTVCNSQIEVDKSEQSSSTSSSATSRSVSPFFKRSIHYDANSQRKKEIDRHLTLMIATDFQPFSIVNDRGFRNLMHVLDPRYVIPSKTTIREKYMTEIYMSAKIKLQTLLSEQKYVAITCDSWTSRATDNYLTVTCQFINNNFEIKSAVLSTKPLLNGLNHTAANIASSLQEILKDWNIEDKVVCIVTDSGANMIKACEILKKRHLPCYAHTLNLVVQDALNLDCVKTVKTKCKEIVRYFKSSTVAMTTLKNEQNREQPLKLIQEVATRWNSSYLMMQRIVEVNYAIGPSLLKLRNSPQPLSLDDVAIIEDLVKVLDCFDEATKTICGNSYVTASMIIPLTHGIYYELTIKESQMESAEGKAFHSAILEGVRKRLFPYETRSVTRLATLLDPRFKKEGFRIEDNSKQAAQLLENEIAFILRNQTNPAEAEETEPVTPVSSPGNNSENKKTLLKFMNTKVQQKQKSVTSDTIIIKRQYLERPNADQDTDPLLFWKVNGNDLRPIPECFQKFCCIPGTSVDSERVFSSTGLLISDRRSKLKEKNVDILTFLNKNQWLL